MPSTPRPTIPIAAATPVGLTAARAAAMVILGLRDCDRVEVIFACVVGQSVVQGNAVVNGIGTFFPVVVSPMRS